MTNSRVSRLLTAALGLALAGCGSPEQKPVDDSQPLGKYRETEIKGIAKSLLKRMDVDEELAFSVQQRLKELLADPKIQSKLESPGCNAVGAFQAGSGGFIFGGGAGSGKICFAGGSQEEPFEVTTSSVGAQVGGSNNFGVVLVFGLEFENRFTDSYGFDSTGGTIGESGYLVGEATPERGTHVVHYCGVGTGASGSAVVGKGKLVLARDETE